MTPELAHHDYQVCDATGSDVKGLAHRMERLTHPAPYLAGSGTPPYHPHLSSAQAEPLNQRLTKKQAALRGAAAPQQLV